MIEFLKSFLILKVETPQQHIAYLFIRTYHKHNVSQHNIVKEDMTNSYTFLYHKYLQYTHLNLNSYEAWAVKTMAISTYLLGYHIHAVWRSVCRREV